MNCVPGRHPSTLYYPQYYGPTTGLGLDDGKCDPTYNREECGYDDGNCIAFNEKYPDCSVSDPSLVGDGECNIYVEYWAGYPVIKAEPEYNSPQCMYDGGDCIEFNEKYPNCKASKPLLLGDGRCDLESGEIADGSHCGEDWCNSICLNCFTEECGWDGGGMFISYYAIYVVPQQEKTIFVLL